MAATNRITQIEFLGSMESEVNDVVDLVTRSTVNGFLRNGVTQVARMLSELGKTRPWLHIVYYVVVDTISLNSTNRHI